MDRPQDVDRRRDAGRRDLIRHHALETGDIHHQLVVGREPGEEPRGVVADMGRALHRRRGRVDGHEVDADLAARRLRLGMKLHKGAPRLGVDSIVAAGPVLRRGLHPALAARGHIDVLGKGRRTRWLVVGIGEDQFRLRHRVGVGVGVVGGLEIDERPLLRLGPAGQRLDSLVHDENVVILVALAVMLIDGLHAEGGVTRRAVAAELLDEVLRVQISVVEIVIGVTAVIGRHAVVGVVGRVRGVLPRQIGPTLDPGVPGRVKRLEVGIAAVIVGVLGVVLHFVEDDAVVAGAHAVADHRRVDADVAVARRPPIGDARPALAVAQLDIEDGAAPVDVGFVGRVAADGAMREDRLP